jgi:hypothetical protein
MTVETGSTITTSQCSFGDRQGGRIVTDWQGRALERGSDGRVIAAGDARVHAQALELLALRDH